MTKIQKAAGGNRGRLKRLAAFGPEFRDPTTVFGVWHEMTGTGAMRNAHTFPSFEYSNVATRFQKMLYDTGWIQDFDWGEWKNGPEGQKLCRHREAIAAADCDQLATLLTTLVRQDRFVEGLLAQAYEDKLLLAIVERAESLVVTTDPV
jgi:thioesterase domain-containing protein